MIDISELMVAVKEGVAEALAMGGQTVADLARQKAPVRKVFAGGHRSFRTKSIAEAEQDRRTLMTLGPQFAAPPRSTLRHPRSRFMQVVTKGNPNNTPFRPSERRLGSPGHLRMTGIEDRLTRRGRFELKSMRAAHQGFLGGRLRSEIYSTAAAMEGSNIVVEVISPTPYAKQQEFGNRHNPAHPYMRPALEESRRAVVSNVAAAVARAMGAGIQLTPITITVHLKGFGV